MIHILKTQPPWFEEVWKGRKPFELRYDDRCFARADILFLREWIQGKEAGGYTGRFSQQRITYVLSSTEFPDALQPGWVVMGMSPLYQSDDPRRLRPTLLYAGYPESKLPEDIE